MLRRTLLALPLAAPAQPADVEGQLASYRQQIDTLDDRIVDLLNRRASIVSKVGTLKKRANMPVAAPGREQQVLDRVATRAARGPLDPEILRRLYKAIIAEFSAWESRLMQAR